MTILLIGVGFVAGLVTVISPCVLPVLPAVLAGGATPGASAANGRRRAIAVAVGLALSFSLSSLFAGAILSFLGLPQDLLYDIALALLFLLAAGLLIPRLGELLARPFARLGLRRAAGGGSGFLLGASLGLVYVPCAGPVLATISVVGSSHHIGVLAVLLTAAYALGIALPMFWLIALSGRILKGTAKLREHARLLRAAAGALIAGTALAITFGAAQALQTAVPSYVTSLETHLERTPGVAGELRSITGEHGPLVARSGQATSAGLDDYGPAPEFTGITAWFNTPGGRPLSLAGFRGKVVLVDFWTYSCINCLRSLPHVEAWYRTYASAGLVVVGVHTPEFDFEHVVGNVRAAVGRLHVPYPVAVDDLYATWNAWGNNSWPAEYLIDQSGHVRYVSIGEGDYDVTERAIRALLSTRPAELPPTTQLPDLTPHEQTTPETYLGYDRLAGYRGTPIKDNQVATYQAPPTLPVNAISYQGVWTVGSEHIIAGADAQIHLHYLASDVYIVMSGTGTVGVNVNGAPRQSLRVSGVPNLYTVIEGPVAAEGSLVLDVPDGVSAYSFTFG